MSWLEIIALLGGVLAMLFAIGTPVALAFLGANLIGAWLFLGSGAGIEQLVRNASMSVNSFSLVPIPLFVLMGELLFHCGLAYKAIEAIERLLHRLPARLGCVSVVGGTAFAALSGSSIANTALLGGTLSQEMLRRGYSTTLALGPVMAVGGIAVLIPPSTLAVMLGSLSGISITQLLIGGLVPGLLMAALFLLFVILTGHFRPQSAPSDTSASAYTLAERIVPFLRDVVPLFGIFVAVIGSMLAGIATPTEAAGLGAFAALIATALYRKLSWAALTKAMTETAKVSVSILFIIVASTTFSQILSFSGATSGMLQLINAVDPTPMTLIVCMLLILLVLGCFIDQISMMMITLPIFMPLAHAAGIEVVWLGLMMLVAIELGMLTPPFGILLMVMQGASRSVPLVSIYKAAAPFILIEIGVLILMLMVPQLTLFLPALVR
ncbi:MULTISPECIES: TRAP transporter large permease [unclassified Salipiger]|uniref:TRAP transporter large permease n=1 Tax=unclassified Salipiger TaxID=2640570 RepID=UPI0013B63FD4|nr:MULTISPECIES: TRAP transporter large permease [unclassified Salipiger]NDV48789.1 TRAP transporter large permease [Salipiger sp. PrR003]NDW31692.1 TRAP transporter large permease [Salipiger sp. PrR007]